MFTMSEWGKRLGAVCLSALMAAAVLVGNAPKVQAAEYRYTDPYVLSGVLGDEGMIELTGGDAAVLAYPLGEMQPLPACQHYRRLNLEDAEGMDAARAGKIRAVLLAVQDLQEPGRAAGEGSNRDEAMTAAREAILCCISGDIPGADCSGLTRYLWALPPVVGEMLLVSDNSLHIRSAVTERMPEGTYRTQIEFTTTATLVPGDELTVTVFCGDSQKSFPLTENNMEDVQRVVFTHGERAEEVRVEVNGYQQGEGVFLFAPSGAPGDAPLLAGCHSGPLPVHAEVMAPVAGELILDIRRGSPGDVEVYRVAELWELLSGVVTPDPADTGAYKTDENRVASLTLDETGCAVVNLSRSGYAEGVYLISSADAGTEDTLVCVPAPDADGEGWQYRVTAELEQGLFLIWWIALIWGLLAGIAVAAALLLRLKRK